jgi:hypothetical protein
MRIEKLGSSNEKLWQNYEKIRNVTQQWDDMLLTVSSTQYKMGHYTAADWCLNQLMYDMKIVGHGFISWMLFRQPYTIWYLMQKN